MCDKEMIDKVDGRINNGGKRPGSGRKLGTPNRVTADVKQMLLTALDEGGGVKYFRKQMEENPTSFNAMIARVMPREVLADVNLRMTDERADEILKSVGLK